MTDRPDFETMLERRMGAYAAAAAVRSGAGDRPLDDRRRRDARRADGDPEPAAAPGSSSGWPRSCCSPPSLGRRSSVGGHPPIQGVFVEGPQPR